MFEMLDSTCQVDAMETKEEHENLLDGAALIDGNQLVEGVSNNEMEGEDDVEGEDVGLGVGQPQQPH